MNCTEFEIAAEYAVETRTSLAAVALAHLSTCGECRRAWELQQQLDVVIGAWRSVQPGVGLADGVLAEIAGTVGSNGWDLWDECDQWDDGNEELSEVRDRRVPTWDERLRSSFSELQANSGNFNGATVRHGMSDDQSAPVTRPTTRSGALVIASAAACLVFAVLFASQFGVNDGNNLAGNRQGRTSDVVVADTALDVSSTLTEVFSDLKSEYREMASETTAMAKDMVDAIPHRLDVSSRPDSDKIELHPNSSDMARILEPIGSRVESAFGFLWNAIPSELPSG